MAKRVVIIGAGVSGLSLGWKLASLGGEVDIIESSSQLGGLAGTFRKDGYCLDFGPHSFFTENDQIQDLFHDLFDHSLKPLRRRVKFQYKGKYLDYPFTVSTVLFQMGLLSGCQAFLSFLKGKLFGAKKIEGGDESVEDWAIANFGNHLYRTFFRPYTEEFWSIKCDELSSRSIPSHTRTNFYNALKLLLKRKATREGSSLVEREKLPTYYPETGYGELPERIAKEVVKKGGRIRLGCRVTKVKTQSDGELQITYTKKGFEETLEADHVVSTIPLKYFAAMLEPGVPEDIFAAAQALDYRPLVVLGLVTEKQKILGEAMYVYQMNRPYNRIFETSKFSPKTTPPGENILALEIPCLRDSVVWNASKEMLFDMCIGSLVKDALLTPGEVKKILLVKAPYAYPIYRKGYAVHLEKVLAYLHDREGIDTLGRTGEFIYMDADKCIKRAFEFGEQLHLNFRLRQAVLSQAGND